MKERIKKIAAIITTTSLLIPTLTYSNGSQPLKLDQTTTLDLALHESLLLQQANERLNLAKAEKNLFDANYAPQVGLRFKTNYLHTGKEDLTGDNDKEESKIESNIDLYLKQKFKNAVELEWIIRETRKEELIEKPSTENNQFRTFEPELILKFSFPTPYLSTTPANEKAKQAIADATLEAAEITYEQAVRDVKLFVTQNYYEVLKITAFVGNQKSYVLNIKEDDSIIKKTTNFEADLMRAATELSSAQDALNNRQNNYERILNNLKSLLGLALTTEISITASPEYLPFNQDLEYCIKNSIQNSLELKKLRAFQQAIQKEAKAAKKGPTRDAKIGLEGKFNPETEEYKFGLGIDIPLPFFDKNTEARQSKSESDQIIISLEMQKEENNIKLEITNLYSALREAENRIKATNENISNLENTRISTIKAYTNKKLDFSALIDLERELQKNNDKKTELLIDYNIKRMLITSKINPENFL
ncbi:TolC family protein [Candidatus Woesearchaeota archaeon]|nr:TolC family protein [Candidatus Woesearchaeota archaeon]